MQAVVNKSDGQNLASRQFSPDVFEKMSLGLHPKKQNGLVACFRGDITDFNAWSNGLTGKEMITYTQQCAMPSKKPDLIDWESAEV